MKVYIVQYNYYSDHYIVGVYANKKSALKVLLDMEKMAEQTGEPSNCYSWNSYEVEEEE